AVEVEPVGAPELEADQLARVGALEEMHDFVGARVHREVRFLLGEEAVREPVQAPDQLGRVALARHGADADGGPHGMVNRMRGFDEQTLTRAVLERMAGARSPRARQISEAEVRRLHALVRELEPTPDEWAAAIDFLTRTGARPVLLGGPARPAA